MKELVDHIVRPGIPWHHQSVPITECGYDASKVKTLSRAEFLSRFIEYGERRMALLTCMTCMDTARRWARRHKEDSLKQELFSIFMLIRKHQDEFEQLMKDADWWGEVKKEAQP